MKNPVPDRTSGQVDDPLECVQGQIAFARRSSDEEAFLLAGVERARHDVIIRNARMIANELSLDREGFSLVRHRSSYANEPDPDVVRTRYLDELVPFIQDYFDASWVVPNIGFSTFVRQAGLPVIDGTDWTSVPGVKAPANGAHVDYLPVAAPMLAALQNQMLSVPIRSYSRLLIVNTWRAVSESPQDSPLAVCDSSSLPDCDLVSVRYTDPESGVAWESGVPYFSPLQRWYYFPDLAPDELLLFKGYDSQRNFNVAHAAFDNRRAFPNSHPRKSIEARFFVYYE